MSVTYPTPSSKTPRVTPRTLGTAPGGTPGVDSAAYDGGCPPETPPLSQGSH